MTGVYGPAIGADDLNNTQIGGPSAQKASYRFRAATTSTLTSVRIYIIGMPAEAGYSAGTGGTIHASIQADDGTALHAPSGVDLASFDDMHPATSASRLYTFASPASVTKGALYHIVFENIDADPVANYVSLDGTFQFAPTPRPWQPRFSDLDFDQMLKQGTKAWTDDRGTGSVITPTVDVAYGDGTQQGQGYMETWGRGESGGTYDTCDGTIRLRETFTVSGSDRAVSSVAVRLARTSGTSPLSIRLETDAGVEIETVTISAASIATYSKGGTGHGQGQAWYGASFASRHTLGSGSTYHLVLSTNTGTEYWTTVIRQGSSYGYGASTYFSDGHAQIDAGSGWADVLGWGTRSNQGDLQFYLR